QPAAHSQWFQYPYVLVQVMPYARLGQHGQVNEDQFPQFIRQLTGQDPKKALDSALKPEARSLLGGMQLGQPQLDSANRRYVFPMDLQVNGIGPVQSLAEGYFGRETLVQVQFCSKKDEWDRYAAAGQAIL